VGKFSTERNFHEEESFQGEFSRGNFKGEGDFLTKFNKGMKIKKKDLPTESNG
jgi:hypothetical protein